MKCRALTLKRFFGVNWTGNGRERKRGGLRQQKQQKQPAVIKLVMLSLHGTHCNFSATEALQFIQINVNSNNMAHHNYRPAW